MKASHSMCGPHQDSDIICGSARYFGWHSCCTPSYHKLSVAFSCSCRFHMHWANIQVPAQTISYPALARSHYSAGTRNPSRTLIHTQFQWLRKKIISSLASFISY